MRASLTAAASSPVTPVVALVTALTGAIGAWQAYQDSSATARASYQALKVASETNTAAIEAIRKGQLDLRVWVEELAAAAARRQATTERAITRKVTKPTAPALPPTPPEPAPKAPPAPPAPAPTSLPPFDGLAKP